MSKVNTMLFLAAVLLFASCKAANNNSEVVAKVNGEPIHRTEMEQAVKFEVSKYDPKIINDEAKVAQIRKLTLDDLVKNLILFQAAKKAGITLSDSELNNEYTRLKSKYTEASFQKMLEFKGIKYNEWKESKKREFVIDKLIDKEVVSKIEISDEDIKKYYNRHRRTFSHGDEVHARQILVDTAKTAEEVRKRAASGENFAALAQEFSIAPESKRGGDLGWFPRGRMPRSFDEACFPLPNGEMSPVVKTEFGYHIFKVLERRQAQAVKIEDVKDKIIALLKQEKIEEAFNLWFEPIRKKAKVEIYENKK